jgi:hypothetical protein
VVKTKSPTSAVARISDLVDGPVSHSLIGCLEPGLACLACMPSFSLSFPAALPARREIKVRVSRRRGCREVCACVSARPLGTKEAICQHPGDCFINAFDKSSGPWKLGDPCSFFFFFHGCLVPRASPRRPRFANHSRVQSKPPCPSEEHDGMPLICSFMCSYIRKQATLHGALLWGHHMAEAWVTRETRKLQPPLDGTERLLVFNYVGSLPLVPQRRWRPCCWMEDWGPKSGARRLRLGTAGTWRRWVDA